MQAAIKIKCTPKFQDRFVLMETETTALAP